MAVTVICFTSSHPLCITEQAYIIKQRKLKQHKRIRLFRYLCRVDSIISLNSVSTTTTTLSYHHCWSSRSGSWAVGNGASFRWALLVTNERTCKKNKKQDIFLKMIIMKKTQNNITMSFLLMFRITPSNSHKTSIFLLSNLISRFFSSCLRFFSAQDKSLEDERDTQSQYNFFLEMCELK